MSIFKKKLFKNGDYSENENIKFNAVLIDKKLTDKILKSVMDLKNINSINKHSINKNSINKHSINKNSINKHSINKNSINKHSNKQLIDNNLESDLNNNFINGLSNGSTTKPIELKSIELTDHLSDFNEITSISNHDNEELFDFKFIDNESPSYYYERDKQLKAFNCGEELDRIDEEIRAEIKESALIKDIDKILDSILNPDSNDFKIDENSYEENDQNKLNKKRALSFDETEFLDQNDEFLNQNINDELIDNKSTIFNDCKIEKKSDSRYGLRKRQKLNNYESKELIAKETKKAKLITKETKKNKLIDIENLFDEESEDESIVNEIEDDQESDDQDESDFNDLILLYSKLNYTTLEDDLELSDDSDIENQTSIESDLKINLINDNTTLKDIYKIEKILAKRYRKSGKLEYLVKYANLDDDQLFWEHEKTVDNKLKDEFNSKYGDKLLLKDIPKESREKFLDKYVDKEILNDEYIDANYDLKELINKSINKPLCDIYNNIKPERIYGIFKHENKFYYLVKWKKLDKADVFECSKLKERFPELVYDYYESRIIFNQLTQRKQSAPLKHNRRFFLEQNKI